MKTNKNIVLSLFLFLSFLVSCKQENISITAMSYNIRYDAAHDGDNIWENRKQGLVNLLKKHRADIIGTQEGLNHQLDYLKSELTDYKMIGIDRDNNGKGEYSSIFYNTNTLNLIETKTFWLSKTPETPSKGWDAALNRICTYALFESKKSNKKFFAFNTHFDHLGEQARLNSALLISKKIEEVNPNKLAILLLGDFNSEPNSEPIKKIKKVLQDGLLVSPTEFQGPIGTFSGFDLNAPLDKRIDYIFVNGFEVKNYTHIDSKINNGNWPSDHLPILIEAYFK
jgi:endonuclease/exonuclease/phosphatase family metal-dependent hydrolase